MSSLRYAYNTNGLQNHRLSDALALLADSGYDGVALTLDVFHHDPFAEDLPGRTALLARRLDELGLGVVVETGARFLLDPRAKHQPTLVSPEPEGRARRLEFLTLAVEVAAGLGAGVTLALEPEPGMLVETVDAYQGIVQAVPSLRLALDVGHCLVSGDRDPARAVLECAADLGTVAIEDMRLGVHEHVPFGEGDLDVASVLAALDKVGFDRLVCVEVSRDSHRAHELVPATLAALRTSWEVARRDLPGIRSGRGSPRPRAG